MTLNSKFINLNKRIINCKKCVRLVAFRKKIANENVSISILPSKVNIVELNINRWRTQLNLPPKNNINTELIKSPFESIGEYHLIHEINNNTNQAILGAIINHTNQTIFIKKSSWEICVIGC